MVESSCDWLSEFLHADTTVLRGIKGVVSAGDDTRLEKELNIERLAADKLGIQSGSVTFLE